MSRRRRKLAPQVHIHTRPMIMPLFAEASQAVKRLRDPGNGDCIGNAQLHGAFPMQSPFQRLHQLCKASQAVKRLRDPGNGDCIGNTQLHGAFLMQSSSVKNPSCDLADPHQLCKASQGVKRARQGETRARHDNVKKSANNVGRNRKK